MKLNKLIATVIVLILAFPALTAFADEQSTNFVKYENDLYYIGYDIPADSYILIQKNKSKPSFVGVYTNNLGPKASLKKKTKLLYGTEDDYVYPHYFETLEGFKAQDTTIADNEGILLNSLYFENNTCIDISYYGRFPNSYSRNDILCLENCYAVSLNDIGKLNLNPEDNGFFPLFSSIKEKKQYTVSLSDDAIEGYLQCYRYNTKTKELTYTGGQRVFDHLSFNIDHKTRTESDMITIPDKTNIILKSGVDIYDLKNNLLYKSKDNNISYSYNFKEKYSFSDVSPLLKANIEPRLDDEYSDKENKNLFRSESSLIKSEADKEYMKYVREILVMYNKSQFMKVALKDKDTNKSPKIYYLDINLNNGKLMEKYFYNASSFKDLDFMLRNLLMYHQLIGFVKIDSEIYNKTAYDKIFKTIYVSYDTILWRPH